MTGVSRRIGCLGLVVGGLVPLSGCLVIPVDYYQTGSRHNVNTKTQATLQVGATTKEEVILSLGEPDLVSEDGQRLGYTWSKVKAIWIVAAGAPGEGVGGAAASGEIERSHVLEVSFDVTNRVSQTRLLNEWGPQVSPVRELEAKP